MHIKPLLKNYNLIFEVLSQGKTTWGVLPKADIQSYNDLNKDFLIT